MEQRKRFQFVKKVNQAVHNQENNVTSEIALWKVVGFRKILKLYAVQIFEELGISNSFFNLQLMPLELVMNLF